MFIILHAPQPLRKILKSCKGYNVSFAVQDRYGDVGRFDEFQDAWVRVDTIEHVILANLDQIDDLLCVVRIRSPENNSIIVKVLVGISLVSI